MSAEDHLRRWLAQGMTGCKFAARIARERHQIMSVAFPELADETDVSNIFEAGRTRSCRRSQSSRPFGAKQLSWNNSQVSPDGVETDDVFVGVDWRVRDGLVSSVMGFAPRTVHVA